MQKDLKLLLKLYVYTLFIVKVFACNLLDTKRGVDRQIKAFEWLPVQSSLSSGLLGLQ